MIDRERRVVYATKTVKHGHQFDVEIFPDFTHLPGTLPKDRSNREAQRNLNDRNSRKECERRINENFGPDDYWVTLTCLPREEPQTMEDALRLFQNYIKRINYRRKSAAWSQRAMCTSQTGQRTDAASAPTTTWYWTAGCLWTRL